MSNMHRVPAVVRSAFWISALICLSACQQAKPLAIPSSTTSPSAGLAPSRADRTSLNPPAENSTQQAQSPPETISGAAANAIVDAAERAQHNARFAGDPNWDRVTIKPEFWGPAIAQLHPIRVWQHHGNIVIVLNDSDQGQEGWYVYPSISSYFPFDNSEAIFEPMIMLGDLSKIPAVPPFPNDAELHAVSLTSPDGKVVRTSPLYRFHSDHRWGP